jgi:hypothetical protein
VIVVPCTHRQANAFVAAFHRHSGPTRGHLWSSAVVDDDGWVRGVSIVGRPVARAMQDGATFEVLRLCTDGGRNLCSMLYSAAWRAGRGQGYWRGITSIRDYELGTSLKAAGWRRVAVNAAGGGWASEGRYRETERQATERWQITAGDHAPPLAVWPETMDDQPSLFGGDDGCSGCENAAQAAG